jgi:hypothetical protein
MNINVKTVATVTDGTYIAFIILMFFGAVLALLLVNASDVIRDDGSRVILMKNPSWHSELWGLYETAKFEPFIVLLFPMFFVSNWFYVYQQNSMNGAYFNTRTRALSSMLYWLYGRDLGIQSRCRARPPLRPSKGCPGCALRPHDGHLGRWVRL